MSVMPHTIRRLIGEPDFSRGLQYYNRGFVALSHVHDARTVTGTVVNRHEDLYDVEVTLSWAKNGDLKNIDGECDCPVGYNCKHVAALMLHVSAALHAGDVVGAPLSSLIGGATPPETLDPRVEIWLDALKRADTPADPSLEDYPANIRDRMHYVIGLDRLRQLTVTPVKRTLRKDGTIGGGRRAYEPQFLRSGDAPKFARPSDVRILTLLVRYNMIGRNYYYGVGSVSPEPEDLAKLLAEVVATGRARWNKVDGPALHAGGIRDATFHWSDVGGGAQSLGVRDSEGRDVIAFPTDPPYYFDVDGGECGPLAFALPAPLVATLLAGPAVPAESAERVASVLENLTSAQPPLPVALRRETRDGGVPVPVLELLCHKANGHMRMHNGYGPAQIDIPALRLGFDYQGHKVAITPRIDPKVREDDKVIVLTRDAGRENAALDWLGDHGVSELRAIPGLTVSDLRPGDLAFPDPTTMIGYAHGEFDGEAVGEEACIRFMSEIVPRLREMGWRIETHESWPYRVHDGPVTILAGLDDDGMGQETTGIDWFSFSLRIEAGGQTLDLLPIILSIVKALPSDLEERVFAAPGLPDTDSENALGADLDVLLEDMTVYPVLPDGSHVALEGAKLAPIVRALLSVYGLDGAFHLAEAGRVADLADALEGSGIVFRGGEALRELGEKLRHLATVPDGPPPAALEGTLRPYQRTGYGWLRALCDTGFGGVLADDMGLGKTIQTLALLVARHVEAKSERPSLLVVPTSLVGNWVREAERFAPGLEVLVLHGSDRKARFDRIPDHDLVITTYPLLHRDHKVLFAHCYELAILDEAQAVKNPTSANAKRIRSIEARQRLALTGTPIENNLEELWSLFDWLIPGLLGNRATFMKRFRRPIEKHGDRAARALLVSRIKPFLLRRTKEEVAPDLPEKSEITEWVALSGDQAGLYETLRAAMDKRVQAAIRAKGLSGSRITILDALLKLRQACCDPGLVKLDAARKVAESAKRARLLEMLGELLAEGRRVLVFSQFVEMLKLIEADVAARGWDYLMLTGRTKKRADLIEAFQTGDAPVFLISLKAGGVGLNLTAADTVILYDPWWNPAVERQAMDRAHRIGQDKAVFVYRLVAEDTVEAAIQELQAKKQALADNLFAESGAGPLALTEADLSALFAPVSAR